MSHNIFFNQNQHKTYLVKANESGQRLDYTLKALFPNMGLRGRKRLWQYYKISVNDKDAAPSYKVKAFDSIKITPLDNCTQLDLEQGSHSGSELGSHSASDIGLRLDSQQSSHSGLQQDSHSDSQQDSHSDSQQGLQLGSKQGSQQISHSGLQQISHSGSQQVSQLHPDSTQNNFIYSIKLAPDNKFHILVKNNYASPKKQYILINALKTAYFFKKDEAKIIQEDENYIFLYKPSGLHSVSLSGSTNSSLESEILHLLPNAHEIVLINRLDKETSGIVMAAHKSNLPNINAWRSLENMGNCTKYYLALVDGQLNQEIIIKNDLDSNNRKKTLVLHNTTQNIIRHTKVEPLAHIALSTNQNLSLVGCSIKKGARHQIRAHLAHAGYPLWGDVKYGGSEHYSFILHHCVLNFEQTKIISLPHWLDKLNKHMQNAIMHWLGNI